MTGQAGSVGRVTVIIAEDLLGPGPPAATGHLAGQSVIAGMNVAARFPALHAANVAALMALYLDGRIKPAVTERFPLARGAEAIARLGARQARGKIVVTIDS